MEYIADASKLTDLPKIEQMGLSKKKVGRSVAEVFAAQIFDIGFVQADGHPRCATPLACVICRLYIQCATCSNVLVRKHPNGTPGQHQIVLIGASSRFILDIHYFLLSGPTDAVSFA